MTPKKKATPKKKRTPRKSIEEADLPKQNELDRTAKESRQALRYKVRYFYDIQRLRIQHQGRITPKAKDAGIQLHEGDVASIRRRFEQLLALEKAVLSDISQHLDTIPFYRETLSDKKRFKGIGPTMAGVLLAEIEIERQDTPSALWSFAGLAPVKTRRCKKCQRVAIVDKKHTNGGEKLYKHEGKAAVKGCPHPFPESQTFQSGRAARPTAGEKLPYNAFLRAKMCGVLGPVLLQVGSPWRSFYDDYRHRKESAGWGVSKGHRHQAAIRYMIKMLLLEIWKEYRAHEGLPVRPPYQEEYLGHTHGADATSNSSNNRINEEGEELPPAVKAELGMI